MQNIGYSVYSVFNSNKNKPVVLKYTKDLGYLATY